MVSKHNPSGNKKRSPLSIFAVIGLCCFFYILGAWQRSGFGKGDSIALEVTKQADCSIFTNLNFETHHNDVEIVEPSKPKAQVFKPCDVKYTDYTPCQEQDRAMKFPRDNMIYRERHCPPEEEKLHCLIPAPKGYMTPFEWPKSRDYVHYANVPHKSLTVEKAVQNWVQFKGNVFKFPGGGTMFPQGADAYIDELASVIPIADGSVRTALDTGCGEQNCCLGSFITYNVYPIGVVSCSKRPACIKTIALEVTKQADCSILTNLNFETHHNDVEIVEPSKPKAQVFKPCDVKYTDYTPCQEQDRAMKFPRDNMIYRERHCPPEEEKLHCLIPAPKGYMTPFEWPKSRDYVHYANVPHKSLTVEKAVQNWVQFKGNVFKFPGGGTMFPQGADAYIDELASVIPIADGSVRTALDTGCGVASWGAYMLKRNVLAMSFAPRDNHEAQVQFALERGVPAVIGVLGSINLPYPTRAFDMAQCSRCLIPWTANDGMYLMEVDRVLRPGGYWVLSGPPINWKTYYQIWKRTKEDLKAEQKKIEELAEQLCWEKKYEKGDIAIFRKKVNDKSCRRNSANMCKPRGSDDVWYKKMETCITPFPKVSSASEVAGGELKKFPARLFAVPPRISKGLVEGVSVETYQEDNKLWKKHVNAYKRINRLIGTARYRNVMDMNAGLGGFAAALESPKSWVMNVVPTIGKDTLGVIYERGLIGIYHDCLTQCTSVKAFLKLILLSQKEKLGSSLGKDTLEHFARAELVTVSGIGNNWCEGFSTYPRTYDLMHANGVFSLYQDKCSFEDILLEMDRILRPEGAVIFRDDVDVLNKVRKIAGGMRWDTKMNDHEDGPLVPEKILVAVKQYWVGGIKGNSTSSAE
ncbi:hypothetical protein GOBAR_AA02899 [Gossypium barbadense]|uniref:Methyltransferase n=1 Tax=Gossypium barbadense TaxID=3634 RepID=A0A2P5YPZ4_GOSBA|nr:hypothetical protein GOBAR_AA02899 [Gossypium barbadense]